MTIAPALIQPKLNHSERKIAGKIDAFATRYRNVSAEQKKELLPEFVSLCKKAEKRLPLFKKIAELYFTLQPADQRACQGIAFPEFEKQALKQLKIPKTPCFYPLLFLVEECTLQKVTPLIKQMHPLYKTLLTVLRSQGLVLNRLIEQRGPPPLSFKTDLQLRKLLVDRTGLPIRQGIRTFDAPPFHFAGTTTHQRLQAPNQSIATDPYADDAAGLELHLEDRTLRLLSITDGGGRGDLVVETAELINRLFLSSPSANAQNIQNEEDAENLLLRAVFQTAQELRKLPNIQHATHAALLSVYTDRNEQFGAVTLLGDTTAYLLTEAEEIHVERLCFQESGKQTSHTGGDFSPVGDYSSLTQASFRIAQVKRACIILGTDGLADNLDPRNCLRPDLHPQIEMSPESYYQKQTIALSQRKLSISDALMNSHDQKDFPTYAATHLYPTPWSLHTDLLEENLNSEERAIIDSISIDAAETWHGPSGASLEQLSLLIDLYAKIKIRTLYQKATPETFAASLVHEARQQGKSDDILAAVCWINL